MNRIFTFALLLMGPALGSQGRAETAFYFTSSPTSWVGRGDTRLYTFPSASISAYRTFDQGTNTNSIRFSITRGEPGTDWWYVDLVGPSRTLVGVGTYSDALRFPFNGDHPGLSFDGNGFGDSTLTGSFQVFEVAFHSNGQLLRFAADFTQYDRGRLADWSFGSIRYNSLIPLTIVPEPSTLVLSVLAFAALPTRRRKSVPHDRI
jgi:hypothetical protein